MDERFENPADEDADGGDEPTDRSVSRGKRDEASTTETEAEQSSTEADEPDEEPLNIRKDWDSATIYVEPEQSEDIEITFTRLKKQLKREGIIVEKNKHFYRGVFEVAFGEHREETKERIRELATQDLDQ
ncbi:hypothetical protein ACFQH3_20720 [Haladaptatus sp. GCM10025707]|uniref:hypothetical protein n=1 Tax=unclassified Haladaptatus TaxID=2622732 RepID=UPI0023E7A986|nr:hypothetical protein [Haladaptatus sp. QDMS2]